MGDVTLKKVIIVALLLMFIIPLFDPDIYTDQANAFDYTLANLNSMLYSPSDQIPLDQIISLINYSLVDHQD
jgi:hypothetical protein